MVIAPQKMDIINPITSFVCPELKVTETWCEKNQAMCYVVQVVYLEMLGTIVGKLGIGEKNHTLESCTLKLMNQTPLNLTKHVLTTKKRLPIIVIENRL